MPSRNFKMKGEPKLGQILRGPLFSEAVRVETVENGGPGRWTLGVVGTRSERFRRITVGPSELEHLAVIDRAPSFDGDGKLLRLGLQAYALGIAYEFDPYFGLSISRVDPLPHQLEAVYDHLLKLARVRFLLADDAGAGKTIMAGLLIRELELRGLAERILIVCPANLTFQWQRELREKFETRFEVMKGADIKLQYGVNPWQERRRIITSLDLAKRQDILPGLQQTRWDVVIVDEAHRMSWSPPSKKTARYALGELLRDSSDHILLLTATPHKGDPENFSLFLQLLDRDAFADVKSIRHAMERRRAPFYLRRTKEAMTYFPQRQPDGSWAARKIFTKRIPRTIDFAIDGDELALYQDISRFVKRQSRRAAEAGDDRRARAIGFLMALYQRRLASSTHAMRRSLEKRARRLAEALKNAQELARDAPELPSAEEIEEMEEGDRQRLEELLEAVTLAQSAEDVREEIAELEDHAARAKAVEDADSEAKLSRLKGLLQQEGFFDQPDRRLLVFSEFKDTLDYLVGKLEEDARLTALFLWTLQSTNGSNGGPAARGARQRADEGAEAGEDDQTEGDDEGEETPSRKPRKKGFTLVYDVVRRFAQPLGIHLDEWEGRVIETEKGVVRLIPVRERARQLFGEDDAAAVAQRIETSGGQDVQLSLFPEDAPEAAAPGGGRGRRRATAARSELGGRREPTTLDRVHAAMLLQASGQAHALRTLLRAEVERGPAFLRLADALSALYPDGSEEERLVDAMLLAAPR